MPEFLFYLHLSLLKFGKLSPFAWLAVLGAVVAAVGALCVFLAGEAIGLERELNDSNKSNVEKLADFALDLPVRDPKPGDKGFMTYIQTIGVLEYGYYIFLAGVLLMGVGIYPFVSAYPP